MIQVPIHDDDRRYAVEVLKTTNFGHRSKGFNGNYEKQYTGLIGELTLHRVLGLTRPKYTSGRLDSDILINNKKVDIKSMARNVYMQDHYVHNFVAYQKDMPSDILLFISINKKSGVVQICGWLEKEKFLENASFFDQGDKRERDDGTSFVLRAPLYEIEQNKLNKLNNVNDLNDI
ncbi:MAG: hypothetical protein CM15mV129_590 [uncultured marine virus]|nr:MAG: hypothetical protein CM15mV129_590 [uncultured marine virus]